MDSVEQLTNAIVRLVAAQVSLKLSHEDNKTWPAMAANAESAAEELRTALDEFRTDGGAERDVDG